MIKVKTGGKLYVAGEYSVLTAGQTALIKHIPIYMTAEADFAESYELWSDMFDYRVDMTDDEGYSLIQDSIRLMEEYLATKGIKPQSIKLSISGKMERDGLKFGIGSSGSVVVLTMKAMASLYQLNLSKDLLFKLSSYVLLKRGDNGSMGDIACIAYEDFIAFTSFDRPAVREKMANQSLSEVLELDWGYQIEPIRSKLPIDFLVGWTRQPALSKDMIKLVKAHLDSQFLEATQEQVLTLKNAIVTGNKEIIKDSINAVSRLLEELNPAIYNDKLHQLRDLTKGLDIVAKSSGAGGGDCGIALSFDEKDSQTLIDKWQEAGIELLNREGL